MRSWIRDRGLGIFFGSVFLVAWAGQLVFEWLDYVNEEEAHGATARFWSEGFWATFWQSTLENWQSEVLQLFAFTVGCAYLVYKGSSESTDSDERAEAKLDALLRRAGIDAEEVEQELPPKYRKRR